MSTTKEELKSWFEAGTKQGATHMLVCWDSFDRDGGDYPVYITKDQNVRQEVIRRQKEHGERIIEVYSYKKTWDEQSDRLVWNYD